MEGSSLSWQKQNMIDQVAATMAVEDMPLTEYDMKNLESLASGEKDIEQVIEEIKKHYGV